MANKPVFLMQKGESVADLPRMSSGQRDTYHAIVQYWHEHGATPTTSDVAEMLGVTNNAAFESIAALTRKGWLGKTAGGKILIKHC